MKEVSPLYLFEAEINISDLKECYEAMGTQFHEPYLNTDEIGCDPHYGIDSERDKLVMTLTELHHRSREIQSSLNIFLHEHGLYEHGFRTIVTLVWHSSLDESGDSAMKAEKTEVIALSSE